MIAVEGEMKQLLLNLTLNALEAVAPGEGRVWVDIVTKEGWVELAVTDNGRGMSAATLARAFEPFYTELRGGPAPSPTVGGRQGTGLGLSITHAIVVAHGGRMEAYSDGLGKGSRFIVRIPAAGDAEMPTAPVHRGSSVAAGDRGAA